MQEKGGSLERSLAGMKRYFREQLLAQAPRLLELATGADAIVSTAMAWSGPSVAEKLGIAALELLPTSLVKSRLHPPPLMPFYGLPRWVNALLWWLSDRVQNGLMGEPLNAARARIGLGPVARFSDHLFVDTPAVIAADPTFMPPDPAWGDRYPCSGYLFLDDEAPLDPALDAWPGRASRPCTSASAAWPAARRSASARCCARRSTAVACSSRRARRASSLTVRRRMDSSS